MIFRNVPLPILIILLLKVSLVSIDLHAQRPDELSFKGCLHLHLVSQTSMGISSVQRTTREVFW